MANLPLGHLANGGAHGKGGRGEATELQAVIHFVGSELPPVSFHPWFGVVQFVLPGKGASCKSSHKGLRN